MTTTMSNKKEETKTTVLPDKSVVVLTGPKNSGKTFAAITISRPSAVGRVYYDDAERSGNRAIAEIEDQGLKIGFYNDLESRFSGALPKGDDLLSRINAGQLPWASSKEQNVLEHYWEYVLECLDKNLERDKYDVYIHDTLATLEAGMAAWVEKRKGFGKGKAGWTSTAYGRMWNEGVYPLYKQFIESLFNRGVKVIVLTSHLKTPWTEGKNPHPIQGKVEPQGKKILYMLSTLMVWLINNPENADGAPAGLILKERLGKLRIVDDKWKPQRMLPERVPHFSWWGFGEDRDSVEWYLEHGVDLHSPRADEVANATEREMISELMTDAQMQLMTMQYEAEAAEARREAEFYVAKNNGNGGEHVAIPSKDILDLIEKANDLGLNEGNAEEIKQTLIDGFPPPLRQTGKAEELVMQAMDYVLLAT